MESLDTEVNEQPQDAPQKIPDIPLPQEVPAHVPADSFQTLFENDVRVRTKLEKLQELIPKMYTWYKEGLATNPPEPLANMTKEPVCKLFKKEATIKRHVILNAFNEEYPSANTVGMYVN